VLEIPAAEDSDTCHRKQS